MNLVIVSPERSSRDTMDLRSFRRVRVRTDFFVNSSRDTMDLRSFRRVRIRTDFLVNALQGAILNRFSSNFVCVYNMARAGMEICSGP